MGIGPQRSHVGIDDAAGEVHGHIVVLVAIAGIEQGGVFEFGQGDVFFQGPARVAVGAVGLAPQAHGLAAQKILDDVGAAVGETAGVDLVERIVLGQFGGAEVGIHGGQAGMGGNVVEPDLLGLHDRRFLTEVEEHAGGAHGREGPGGHHVHFLSGLDLAEPAHGLDHFSGRQHHGLALFNAFVDFRDGLFHFGGHSPLPFPRRPAGAGASLGPFPAAWQPLGVPLGFTGKIG